MIAQGHDMPIAQRRQVTDVRALRGLANPIRYRLLGHLLALGAQTASECAAAVGASPSNCSYHLRELERFGLIERAPVEPGADGRDRPWRPAATGHCPSLNPQVGVGTTARPPNRDHTSPSPPRSLDSLSSMGNHEGNPS